jgi:hypothetical protein
MRTGCGALLLLLLILAGAGWWFRDEISGLLTGSPELVEVSPEAAASAETKIQALLDGGDEARLSDIELSSMLRYRTPDWAKTTIRDPSVRIDGDTVVLMGIVPTNRLPSHPDLDRIRMFLPDSADIEVTGTIRPLSEGRSAFEVTSVQFAGLPVPDRYYPEVLENIGREDEPGLSPSAVALALPEGVSSARVEDGQLILIR